MSNNRRIGLKTAFLATSMLTLGSGIAFAQDTDSGETVVVTGSRISTAGFTAPTPVTSENAAEIAARAPGVVSDVLNQMPEFRLTIGNSEQPTANFNGQNQVDLRGLGVNRTLVLLDGERFVPTNTNSSVDVNSIPVLLLQRVDVVTGGASAAYGSDAVAGVVNFVMKDRMEGVIGNITGGISEYGDNIETDYNIAAGHSFFNDRLHEVISFEDTDNKGVGNPGTRPSEYGNEYCSIAPTAAQRAAQNLPANYLTPDCEDSNQATSSVVTGGYTAAGTLSTAVSNITFGPGGQILPFNVGTVAGGAMYGGLPNPTDPQSNSRDGWQLEEPHRSIKVYDKLTLDLDNDTSVFIQALWADNWNATANSGTIQNIGIIVPVTGPFANPYVPAALQAAAINNGLTALSVGRLDLASGGQSEFGADITSRLATGIKGKVFGDWDWSVFYTHGQSSAHTYNTGFNMEANFLNSTFAVAGPNGTAVCGPAGSNPNFNTGAVGAGRSTQVTPGCVPFNIFGPTDDVQNHTPNGNCYHCGGVPQYLIDDPVGSAAAVNYFDITNESGSYYQQDAFSAQVNGTPFSTWAGPAALAVGMDHRREGGSTFNGLYGTLQYSNNSGGAGYSGQFNTTEGYFELITPMLKNEWYAESLDVDIAFRETGYSLFGVLPTYKVGVDWQVNDDWRIRANRSRDVREPSIADLFATQAVAINTSFTNPITHLTGIEYQETGGNPNLKPETADSNTLGIVYTPASGFLEGLNASIDYYSIKIQHYIFTQSPQVEASACATGNQLYCALILPTGGPSGSLLIETFSANLNSQRQAGVDLEIGYTTGLDRWDLPGQLNTRLVATYTDYNINSGITKLEEAGAAQGEPKLEGSINMTYLLGPSATNVQMRYVSGSLADATLIGPGQSGYSPTLANSINVNQFPEQVYFDFGENYDFYTEDNTKLTAFFNINNLLDKDPPLGFGSVIAYLSGGNPYDVIGRTFKGGIRFKF